MKLQGRHLSIGLMGDDVKLLHSELRQLGFVIADEEVTAGSFGEGTRKVVLTLQQQQGLQPSGIVDEAAAAAINAAVDKLVPQSFVVRGTVRRQDGQGAAGLVVRAFDRDLRSEELLGEATTNDKGGYEISYQPEQFQRAEKDQADIVVAVYRTDGTEWVRSQTVFNAKPVETIDLFVAEGTVPRLSEYEQLVKELTPLLQGLSFAELTEDETHQDITFLTQETGIAREWIRFLTLAHQHAKVGDIAPEAFYGCFRQNLPTDLKALAALDDKTVSLALATASAALVIPELSSEAIDSILKRLHGLHLVHQLDAPIRDGAVPLRDVISTVLSTDAQRQAFAELSLQSMPFTDAFWNAAEAVPDLGGSKVINELRFAMETGSFVQYHLPLLKALQKGRQEGRYPTVRSLAKLDTADWQSLLGQSVDNAPVGVPKGTPGKDPAEKVQNYVQSITTMIDTAFPTDALARQLGKDAFPGQPDLKTFFDRNPEFDFQTNQVTAYTKDATTLAGVKTPEVLVQQLQQFERVFKMTPSYPVLRKLVIEDGHDSLHKVAQFEPEEFAGQYAAVFGSEAKALEGHSRAVHVTALVQVLFTTFGKDFNQSSPKVVPTPTVTEAEEATWASLFGNADFCACQHCRSVYGPAAYLVNLLAYLKNRLGHEVGRAPYDLLMARRPDLVNLELSCENTNTLVPCIDLANEILEGVVAGTSAKDFRFPTTLAGDLDRGPQVSEAIWNAFRDMSIKLTPQALVVVLERGREWRIDDEVCSFLLSLTNGELLVRQDWQTRETDEVRRAIPQFIERKAYNILAGAVYPWSLPFELPWHEARTCLTHLGIERHELMRFVHGSALERALDLAAEQLGIAPAEVPLITTMPAPTGRTLAELFGFRTDEVSWQARLRSVPEFLTRTGLQFTELEQLLTAGWLQPTGKSHIARNPSDECNVSLMTIEPAPSDEFLARVHQFIRCWRHTAWSLPDIDRVLRSFNEANIGPTTIIKLSQVKTLERALRLTPDRLAALWAPIDTMGAPSLYERLFQNRTVTNPVDPAFQLNAARTELQLASGTGSDPRPTLASHQATVCAALRLSAADLALLAQSDEPLTLEMLSRLHRHALLAQALGLPVRQFMTVKQLTGANPFHPGNPAAVLEFLDLSRTITGSPFTIEELEYLHRDVGTGGTLRPDEKEVQTLAKRLVESFLELNRDTTVDAAPARDLAHTYLPVIMSQSLADEFCDLLEDRLPLSVAASTTLPALSLFGKFRGRVSVVDSNRLQVLGPLISDERGALLRLSDDSVYQQAVRDLDAGIRAKLAALYPAELLSPSQSPQAAVSDLLDRRSEDPLDQPSPGGVEYRLAYVVNRLMPLVRERLTAPLVVRILADSLELPVDTVEWLLQTHLATRRAGATDRLVADFIALRPNPETGVPVVLDNTSEQYVRFRDAYRLMRKAATLVHKCTLKTEELQYFVAQAAAFGNFDLNRLPLAPLDDPGPLLAQLIATLDYVTVRDGLPPSSVTLLNVLAPASIHDVRWQMERLSVATGWNSAVLDPLLNGLGLQPTDFVNVRGLIRLRDCLAAMTQIGASPAQLFAWASPTIGFDVSSAITMAVKSRYPEDRWLEVARTLRDPLRELQRSALVAYLLAHPFQRREAGVARSAWKDTNGLYAYFLIDFDMSACQSTSRIKQAISSVQLFIQRCFLGLEDTAQFSPTASWWKWMKSYRIWEANRKVFLYPENWVEPDLRERKSPFFKDLETELQQQDLTAETAELAFNNYLTKLDEVARLKICGTVEDPETQTLHVFGRTKAEPYTYFYRRRMGRDGSYWTPWEKVDLDIEGDQLIPVVWERRLYLFWPMYSEKPVPPEISPEGFSHRLSETIRSLWTAILNSQALIERINLLLDGPRTVIALDFAFVVAARVLRKPARERASELSALSIPSLQQAVTQILERLDELRQLLLAGHAGGARDGMQEQLQFLIETLTGQADQAIYASALSTLRDAKDKLGTSQQTNDSSSLPAGPDKYWEIKLAWSEYKDGLWSGKRIAKESAPEQPREFWHKLRYVLSYSRNSGSRLPNTYQQRVERMAFVARTEETSLTITCYLALSTDTDSDDRKLFPLHAFSFSSCRGEFLVRDILGWPLNMAGALPFRVDSPAGVVEIHDSTYAEVDPTVQPLRLIEGMGHGNAGDLSATWRSTVLSNTSPTDQDRFQVICSSQQFPTEQTWWVDSPFLYEDHERTFVVTPTLLWVDRFPFKLFRVETFYHPYVCTFITHLRRAGIDGLLKAPRSGIGSELWRQQVQAEFWSAYQPASQPSPAAFGHPKDDVDFAFQGSYALYNWELFFHAPLLIADWLSKNQRFEEAQQWFHYIFDPTENSPEPVTTRCWRLKPFAENGNSRLTMPYLMRLLSQTVSGDAPTVQLREDLNAQIRYWQDHPFAPHTLAQLRITPYQKTVVMKYLDNLIAWADDLFKRDTMEAINEATQLYILAAEILGERPKAINGRSSRSQTFAELAPKLDAFSNALVALESMVPSPSGNGTAPPSIKGFPKALPSLYFCIPHNDRLLQYWDTVADRLFKIRHCMNIDGVTRTLALFEPPIDPAILVRATAAGLDLSRVVADLDSPPPFYRFAMMLQKANEFCGEVRSLGAALLSALEKKDAEELAQMRSRHELDLLTAVREVKQQQIEEASQTLAGLTEYKKVVTFRRDHYAQLEFMNLIETTSLELAYMSATLQFTSSIMQQAAGSVMAFPELTTGTAGFSGSPVFLTTEGGHSEGQAMASAATAMQTVASFTSALSGMTGTMGGYSRRQEEWDFQKGLAEREITQIDKQIASAEIRVEIAKRELENHERQVKHSQEVDEHLRRKFTSKELYGWMSSQLAALYSQSYRLAYSLAKKAERAYQFERGLTSASFIRFGQWDGLRRGLLAGEQLALDLKRLETAYLEQNRREYEISKQISLVMHDPLSLIQLKHTGQCIVRLPEILFDADYPGHYMRRIKNVSLTIPAVVGPYTSMNCTLTLLNNKTRVSKSVSPSYEEQSTSSDADPRFVTNFATLQSIATSHGQNDTGMFEINFRDERYLPFEGAGVISDWRLELPTDTNAFDLQTITDVILRINYTAREGGDPLRKAARDKLNGSSTSAAGGTPATRIGQRLFSLRHEFPTEWAQFQQSAGTSTMQFNLLAERFPFQFRRGAIIVQRLDIFLIPKGGITTPTSVTMAPPATDPSPITIDREQSYSGLPHGTVEGLTVTIPQSSSTPWRLNLPVAGPLRPEDISDILMVCEFTHARE